MASSNTRHHYGPLPSRPIRSPRAYSSLGKHTRVQRGCGEATRVQPPVIPKDDLSVTIHLAYSFNPTTNECEDLPIYFAQYFDPHEQLAGWDA